MKLSLQQISDPHFDQCIKCTVCTAYCPVVVVNPNYPGPKQAGPDGERLRLKKGHFYDEALKYCMNCKRCEVACPSNVKIGDIILAARLKYNRERPKWRDFFLSHTDWIGKLSTPLAPVVNRTLRMKYVRNFLDYSFKIDRRRRLPEYVSETFEEWYQKQAATQQQYTDQVTFFHGCYTNYNYPQLGKDLVKVFNAMDIGVQLLEKEKCCGVALISNGFINRAKRNASTNMVSIRNAILRDKHTVVTTSSSCTFTIRDEYPILLDIDNSDIRDHVELATRYIYRLLKERKPSLKFSGEKIRVAYHTPCHLDKLGWAYYSIRLLKLIPDIEVTILPSLCCGIAGTYGFKTENYQTSQDIGNTLFTEIDNTDADYVVTDCETCKWQIEMSTDKICEHPVSLLARVLE